MDAKDLQLVRLRELQREVQSFLNSPEVRVMEGMFPLVQLQRAFDDCQAYEVTQPAQQIVDAVFRKLEEIGYAHIRLSRLARAILANPSGHLQEVVDDALEALGEARKHKLLKSKEATSAG